MHLSNSVRKPRQIDITARYRILSAQNGHRRARSLKNEFSIRSRGGSLLCCSSRRSGPLRRQCTSRPPPRSSTWWLSSKRITRSMRTSPPTPWPPTHPGNPRSTRVRKRRRSTGSPRPCSSGIRTHRIHSASIGCSRSPATRTTITQRSRPFGAIESIKAKFETTDIGAPTRTLLTAKSRRTPCRRSHSIRLASLITACIRR
jgi:hypothetical protein